jgi:SpoIIAA-like
MKTETPPVYNVYFDEAQKAVVMEWNNYATTEKFREGTELMLNELISHHSSKVLANIKNMTLISSEDQKWLEEMFLPRAIRFGFRSIAIVKPKSYFNQVAIDNVTHKIGTRLNMGFFDTAEEAKAWLSSH